MINNPTQVKSLIRNLAKGDSSKAQLLQRRYAMERFLERMAQSAYRQNLVLKGGMLVTSMLDVGQRMTRDADVTMQKLPLDVESATAMVKNIAAIPLEDGMVFDVESAYEIMEESEIMAKHWARYQDKNDFASGVSWKETIDAARSLCAKAESALKSV